jgi:MoxR-like ATPase
MDPAAILNRDSFCANLCLLSSSQPVRLGCGQGPLSEGSSLAIQTHADAYEIACRLLDNIETVVHGKRDQITLVIAALVCGGHALLEDVPGTAKTVLARAIAQSIEGAHSSRIQCTPDLQPTDVTGLSIFNQRERDFEFRPGPVFANVVLVDEINRAMPKTQSALLEAMAEQQVTVDGVTRPLAEPFLVMATQNPIEYEGTFPLPEAQLDRFFVRTTLGYPDAEDESRIVDEQLGGHPLARLRPTVDVEDIHTMSSAVREVFVHEVVGRWIVELVRATRELELVAIGSSVRGSLALNRATRAWAMLNGRRYVTPEDVERLFVPVLMHRLLFRPSFLAEIRDSGWEAAASDVQQRCLALVPKPGFDIDLDVPATAV